MRGTIRKVLFAVGAVAALAAVYSYHRDGFWLGRNVETREAARLIGGAVVRNGFVSKHIGGTREIVSADVIVCRYWSPLKPARIERRAYWPEGTVPERLWLRTGTTLPAFPGHCPVWWQPAGPG